MLSIVRPALAVVLVLSAVSTPLLAHAQPSPGTDDEARGLFLAGQAAFESSRYEEALRYFREAYSLSGRPQLLYNIAIAADRLRRDAEALEAFEQFLRDAPPDAPQRRDVEARAEVLRAAIAREAEAEPPSPEPSEAPAEPSATEAAAPVEPAPPPPSPEAPIAPWIVVGVSGAVAVGGAVLLALGRTDAAAVENAPDGSAWADVEGAAGRAEAESIAGIVLLAAGAAGAAAGVAWGLIEGGSEREGPTAELRIAPGGVVLAGEF